MQRQPVARTPQYDFVSYISRLKTKERATRVRIRRIINDESNKIAEVQKQLADHETNLAQAMTRWEELEWLSG